MCCACVVCCGCSGCFGVVWFVGMSVACMLTYSVGCVEAWCLLICLVVD